MVVCYACSVLQSCLTLCDPMDCSRPGSPSMGFSRQEYWSGLPFPPLGDLPSPGIEPTSPVSPALRGGFFTTATWEGLILWLVKPKTGVKNVPKTKWLKKNSKAVHWPLFCLSPKTLVLCFQNSGDHAMFTCQDQPRRLLDECEAGYQQKELCNCR